MNRFWRAALRPMTTTDWDRASTFVGEEDIVCNDNTVVAKRSILFFILAFVPLEFKHGVQV